MLRALLCAVGKTDRHSNSLAPGRSETWRAVEIHCLSFFMVINNMIYVTFPAGCYGSYVMQSIYAYSNLGNTSEIIINSTGSSHDFRNSAEQKKYFVYDHKCALGTATTSNIFRANQALKNPTRPAHTADVCIQSLESRRLDYMNNQLVKQENNDIVASIQKSFPEFNEKLAAWPDNSVWALREWISFWLMDTMISSYHHIPWAHITTDDLFDTDKNVFPDLINRLGLTVTADNVKMKLNQQQWISQQRYHNSQNRCDAWVQDILQDNNTPTPCQTILDEAYVQHCLQEQGYNIRCNGLDKFPATSGHLRELIYENSNTNNN